MQPSFFINHGGEPCFFLDPDPMRAAWTELEDYLRDFTRLREEQSRVILVVSGLWEVAPPTANAGAVPPLLFDYGGFPQHTYQLTCPAAGARQAQPHEDHLLPLMVAAGAASEESGRTAFHGHALGKPISDFRLS
jgi:aromatic ring-opening dioxygenase catalytic subunit (LigB family)